MRPLTVLLFLLPLCAQDPVQPLVEQLYPKDDRLKGIHMGEIVRQLGIHEGSQVADVGCGSGEFSVILSHVVGKTGKVFCEDISDQKDWGLPVARTNLRKQHVKNALVIHGGADDPKLPRGALDAVLIVNAYHEMPKYSAMLAHIRESLKEHGRLVIVDNTPLRTSKRPREKQANNHVLSADLAAAELQAAGFKVIDRQDTFVDDPDSEKAHWLIAVERQ